MSREPNCACVVCGKPIYRRPSPTRKATYCSHKCLGVDQRKKRECPVCGAEIPSGRVTCSRACANKYRVGTKYTGEQPRSKKSKSDRLRALVAEVLGEHCERCGYDRNTRILEVHHIVKRSRGGSDDLYNLCLLCPNCHREAHLPEGWQSGLLPQP